MISYGRNNCKSLYLALEKLYRCRESLGLNIVLVNHNKLILVLSDIIVRTAKLILNCSNRSIMSKEPDTE